MMRIMLYSLRFFPNALGDLSMSCVIIDITNQRFGRLIARYIAERRPTKSGTRIYWFCDCDCGNTKNVASDKLRDRRRPTQSCGCLWEEVWDDFHVKASEDCRANLRDLPEHPIWLGMIRRCYDPRATGYSYYGGRGITVCDRWRYSFKAFYEDKGPRPSPKHSIDRWPSPNGDYCPENTRWATKAEQSRNHSRNHWITYQDRTLCLQDWANEFGISANGLKRRIDQWGIERAFSTPLHKGDLAETARNHGINEQTFRQRIRKGLSIHEAVELPVKENHLITYQDLTLPLAEWARRSHMSKATLRQRLVLHGWSIERALTEAVHPQQTRNTLVKGKHLITHKGLTLSLSDWARKLGIAVVTLRARVRKWSIERALSEALHHQNSH
jgi:hypothetical protein